MREKQGIVFVVFGTQYDCIAAHTVAGTRQFTDLPITVLTNISPEKRHPKWRSVPGVAVRHFRMPDSDNREVKTSLNLYSPYDRTLYMDADAAVQQRGVEKLFEHELAMYKCFTWGSSILPPESEAFMEKHYRPLFNRLGVKLPIDIYAGGLILFDRSHLPLFDNWNRFWRITRGRDMPALNASIRKNALKPVLISPEMASITDSASQDGNPAAVIQHECKGFAKRYGYEVYCRRGGYKVPSVLPAPVAPRPRTGLPGMAFIQYCDDRNMPLVLHNRALMGVSLSYPLFFAYSGKQVSRLREAYPRAVVIETKNDMVLKYRELLKLSQGYDYVVRTCCDTVIGSVRGIADIARQVDPQHACMIGTPLLDKGRIAHLRGACNILTRAAVDRMVKAGEPLGTGPNVDSRAKEACIRLGIEQLARVTFEMTRKPTGATPVWHPWKQTREKEPVLRAFVADAQKQTARIALLVPSRDRMAHKMRLCESIQSTAANVDDVHLYFGVDGDDPSRAEAKLLPSKYPFVRIVDLPAQPEFRGLAPLWNIVARKATEPILAMIGDDMVFETRGWDREVIREFESAPPDGWKLVYGHDGDAARHAVNSFINRGYLDLFGYYVREEFQVDGIDVWLEDVYRALGRCTFRFDIVIRHLHYRKNLAERDMTATRMNTEVRAAESRARYRALQKDRDAEVAAIQRHLAGAVCTSGK